MIRIDTVRNTNVKGELRLTGKVAFDDEKVIKIYPQVSGLVLEVKAELGDRVEKGQVLAVIRSSEIAGYVQQRATAEANLQIAKKNLEAAEEMHSSGVSSEKELLTTQREYAKAEAEWKRADEIFKIFDISGGQSEYRIKAPISGFIAERKINNGMQLRPDNADNLFTLSNLDDVWVTANIYETDIAKIKAGYDADVTTLSYEGKVFKGKVDKVLNVIDPETKAMKVRIKLANPDLLLKPEMFASIDIHYLEADVLPEVPSESVIFDKSKNFILVYTDRSNIQTREVNVYKTVGGQSFIRDGVKDGDMVISKYHMLVYDELNGG